MRRKLLLVILVVIGLITGVYVVAKNRISPMATIAALKAEQQNTLITQAFALLKARKDADALAIFEKTLLTQPNSLDALWGKAEVLRRRRDYQQAEKLFNEILKLYPGYVPALISLSYNRYKDDELNQALKLINQALKCSSLDKESQALAYMMLGSINSRRSQKGWLLGKLAYGTQIKCYFLKAEELAGDLPEVHLGLGTFYLLAPAIAGGNLGRAVQELELAVKIAPDFATANARLAQAYKKKGDLEKYNSYLRRARALDPENEALKEIYEESRNQSNIP